MVIIDHFCKPLTKYSHVPTVDDRQINRCYCFFSPIVSFSLFCLPVQPTTQSIYPPTCIIFLLYLCAYTKHKLHTYFLTLFPLSRKNVYNKSLLFMSNIHLKNCNHNNINFLPELTKYMCYRYNFICIFLKPTITLNIYMI